MAGSNKKKPTKQYPFPRSATKPITGPEYHDGMTWEEARAAWFAYLRIVTNIRPMNLPPLHHDS